MGVTDASYQINGLIGSTKGKGWALGQDWDGGSVTDLFKGEIDEVAIYNRDLTANEVGYLYSSKSTINSKYDPIIGRLDTRTINSGANSFVTTYNYEGVEGVNGATTTKISSIENDGKSIVYTYEDNSNNIETITENNKKITYTYNEANELTREDNQVLNKTIVYDYDAGGNFKTKIEYPYTPDKLAALPTSTNTVSYTYGDTNWKDKLTNFNGKAITYDAIGNPLTYDGYTYSWEWGRQLASMTGNGKTISYKYNDSGIRTQKTVNNITTNYHLVGDKVTYEDNGTDKIYYTYDSSDNLVSMNLNGVEYYYIRNAQNDIIGLFDSDGNQVASYTYDSWGKLISIKDVNGTDITNDIGSVGYKNPYRYRGYRYDTETGLYYLQSRYYNPDWGRFINADGIIGETGQLLGHNLFAYCGNDPINRIDPDGYLWGEIKEFFTQLANAINTLKPVYATAGAAAIGDGPSPVGDVIGAVTAGIATIGAVGVAGYQTYKTISTSSTKSKTKAVPISNTKRQRSEYFEASTKKGGGINIGSPLTLTQAQTRVLKGADIYAISQNHAVLLAGILGGTERGPDKPEIHPWSPENKYHYHLKGHKGGHIFFDK